MLPRADWLQAAQALAIGRKRRMRHNFESSAALDVYNNEDSWSCWCHRCHQGGIVYKEHQTVRRVVTEPDRIGPVPATCTPLADATEYDRRRVWNMLVQKGCPPGVIPEDALWYDRSIQRMLLKSGTLALGRALDSRQAPKWLAYGEWHGKPMVWWTRTGAGAMVLVEDALSGYKVAKAINSYAPSSSVSVVATLGTIITDRFLPEVAGKDVLCMYDGDNAGLCGYERMRKRLRVWGGSCIDLRPETGDPKNLDLATIANRLKDFI